jgi:prophage regulatory protein
VPTAKQKKPSAAAKVRVALDVHPPKPSDDDAPPEHRRALVELARPPPRLLSKAEVLRLVPVSYPTLWAMMLRGEFPRARKLAPGSNRVAWRADEVFAWIETLPLQALKADRDE